MEAAKAKITATSPSSSSTRASMKPIGSLLKVDPTAREVTDLSDLRKLRVRGDIAGNNNRVEDKGENKNEDLSNQENGQNGSNHEVSSEAETAEKNHHKEEIDVEIMEKLRYKLIAASYSYWLSAPRDTTSSGHPQDRDHIGMLFSKMDKKRDGIVRVKEVSNAVKDLCPNTTSLQLDVFSRMVDMNNTGFVRKEEFIQFIRTKITSLPPPVEDNNQETTTNVNNDKTVTVATTTAVVATENINAAAISTGEASERLDGSGRGDDELIEMNDLKEIMDFVQEYKSKKKMRMVTEILGDDAPPLTPSTSYTEDDIRTKLQLVLDSTEKHAKRIEELEFENSLLKSNINRIPRAISLDESVNYEAVDDNLDASMGHVSPAVVLSAPHRFPQISSGSSITAVTPIKMATLSSPVRAENSPPNKRYKDENSVTSPLSLSPHTPSTNRRGGTNRKQFNKMPYYMHPKQNTKHVNRDTDGKSSSTSPSRSLLREDDEDIDKPPYKSRQSLSRDGSQFFVNLNMQECLCTINEYVVRIFSPRYSNVWRAVLIAVILVYIRLSLNQGTSSSSMESLYVPEKYVHSAKMHAMAPQRAHASSSSSRIIADAPSADMYTNKRFHENIQSSRNIRKPDFPGNHDNVNECSSPSTGIRRYLPNVSGVLDEISNFIQDERERKSILESGKLKVREKLLDVHNGLLEASSHLDHLRPYLNILQVITGIELLYYKRHAKTLRGVIKELITPDRP